MQVDSVPPSEEGHELIDVALTGVVSRLFADRMAGVPVHTRLADVQVQVRPRGDGCVVTVYFTYAEQKGHLEIQVGSQTAWRVSRQFYNVHQRLRKQRGL